MGRRGLISNAQQQSLDIILTSPVLLDILTYRNKTTDTRPFEWFLSSYLSNISPRITAVLWSTTSCLLNLTLFVFLWFTLFSTVSNRTCSTLCLHKDVFRSSMFLYSGRVGLHYAVSALNSNMSCTKMYTDSVDFQCYIWFHFNIKIWSLAVF